MPRPIEDDLSDIDWGSSSPRRPTTEASYEGRCPDECGMMIEIGDTIVLTDDGWVLKDCASG